MKERQSRLELADQVREHIIRKYGSHRKAAEAYGVGIAFISNVVCGWNKPPLYMLEDMGMPLTEK